MKLKKGIELGYKFKLIRAVKFEKGFIFSEFVNYFYNFKKKVHIIVVIIQ